MDPDLGIEQSTAVEIRSAARADSAPALLFMVLGAAILGFAVVGTFSENAVWGRLAVLGMGAVFLGAGVLIAIDAPRQQQRLARLLSTAQPEQIALELVEERDSEGTRELQARLYPAHDPRGTWRACYEVRAPGWDWRAIAGRGGRYPALIYGDVASKRSVIIKTDRGLIITRRPIHKLGLFG